MARPALPRNPKPDQSARISGLPQKEEVTMSHRPEHEYERPPLCHVLVLVALVSCLNVCGQDAFSGKEFDRIHSQLQLDMDAPWRSIPWQTSLLKAQSIAAKERKPIFVWAMNGNPLGCTCINGLHNRESNFANPEIVELIRTQFIPVGIDISRRKRQTDAEGRFYRKITEQGPRDIYTQTTQGLYVAAPDGAFLGYNNTHFPKQVIGMLRTALEDYEPASVSGIEPGKPDSRFNRNGLTPPKGGFVARVGAKVLGGYPRLPADLAYWEKDTHAIMREAIGRDNLWVRADEKLALQRGQFPKSLLTRLTLCNLVDNTHTHAPIWRLDEIIEMESSLKSGKFHAKIRLATMSKDRSYDANLIGHVEFKGSQITRFDIVAKGDYHWSKMAFLGKHAAPKDSAYYGPPAGKYPLAIAFSLALGDSPSDRIPPHWLRSGPAYLK
ncbi:MAG: hypothetical protein ACI8W8_002600 [Rhodothermales bacterium]|jgi:hypothetical protein